MQSRLSFNACQDERALWPTGSAEDSITACDTMRLVTSTLVIMAETAQATKREHGPVTQHLGL